MATLGKTKSPGNKFVLLADFKQLMVGFCLAIAT